MEDPVLKGTREKGREALEWEGRDDETDRFEGKLYEELGEERKIRRTGLGEECLPRAHLDPKALLRPLLWHGWCGTFDTARGHPGGNSHCRLLR